MLYRFTVKTFRIKKLLKWRFLAQCIRKKKTNLEKTAFKDKYCIGAKK